METYLELITTFNQSTQAFVMFLVRSQCTGKKVWAWNCLSLPYCFASFFFQEHQCAAKPYDRPRRRQLFPPAAWLRHHRIPRPASGPDQLCLQVAAIHHERESGALTLTHPPNTLTLSEHTVSQRGDQEGWILTSQRPHKSPQTLFFSVFIKSTHTSRKKWRLTQKRDILKLYFINSSFQELWRDPQISKRRGAVIRRKYGRCDKVSTATPELTDLPWRKRQEQQLFLKLFVYLFVFFDSHFTSNNREPFNTETSATTQMVNDFLK